ncbi:hypothetical protein KFL_003220080 [Klebsormidium nitens]|uniref:Uncharacterized protein n=1 Tax=Klebsormidium nitens TaxID=105231 RepID=A0A1Y1IE14_KLENI|nr:hypothetical protein KFL_003220080 [Klebsormidium nitens]|eukprot:GAQ86946.1 hypothetical protein KFL_003220080 [Klebsormidium nitens]
MNLGFNHFVSSTAALAILTGSKLVVESCLRVQEGSDERVNAQELYQRLMQQADQTLLSMMENAGGIAEEGFQLLVAGSLECLANCVRGSKVFRDAMREAMEQRNMFEQFGKFLSTEFLSRTVSAEVALIIRLHLAGMAVSLAFSADSRLWAIDRGLLKLVAAIYEASPLREHRKLSKQSESPLFRCNKVLLRLLTVNSAAEKMRAHNALEDLRPHKRKINSAEPETEPWAYYERFLEGGATRLLRRERSVEEWKDQEEKLSGDRSSAPGSSAGPAASPQSDKSSANARAATWRATAARSTRSCTGRPTRLIAKASPVEGARKVARNSSLMF